MRLDNFEAPPDAKPLGEGSERRVFVDPNNESRVIAEKKEGTGRETPQKLKGRFYLTKIVHQLLPENVPDIYQTKSNIATEVVRLYPLEGSLHEDQAEEEFIDLITLKLQQTIDRERMPHTPGHAALQKALQSNEDPTPAEQQMVTEMAGGMGELDMKLEKIGLGFGIDEHAESYTKDAKGNVQYLGAFNPWEIDVTDPNKLEVLFDEEGLRGAIEKIPNESVKKECTDYLERLLVLKEEDERGLQERNRIEKEKREECGPFVAEVKAWLTPFLEESMLTTLNAIQTEEEADKSIERALAKKALIPIYKQLEFLREKTNITPEAYDELDQQRKILSRAVGMINRKEGMTSGTIDHTR